jgi:hypothetical protein
VRISFQQRNHVKFVDHPVFDQPILIVQEAVYALSFLAPVTRFDLNTKQGRDTFLNALKHFKDPNKVTPGRC